jgi:glycosyltransferase involved in cell wall biosynthesis
MLNFYTVFDVFLMPSPKRLNPLPVIEALWAGLPVFILIGGGKYPKDEKELENGWVVNHGDPDVVPGTLSHLIDQTKEEREAFGARTTNLSMRQILIEGCIENYVNENLCIK